MLGAQQPGGEIRLSVKDPSGGSGCKQQGKLTGPGGADRTFETDGQGSYTFSNLPPGRYRLEVSKNGLSPQSAPIDVQPGAPASRTVTLALATQASKIDVVATTPLAGTDLAIDQIAGPVQTATAADVVNSGALDLGDFMKRRLNGVGT